MEETFLSIAASSIDDVLASVSLADLSPPDPPSLDTMRAFDVAAAAVVSAGDHLHNLQDRVSAIPSQTISAHELLRTLPSVIADSTAAQQLYDLRVSHLGPALALLRAPAAVRSSLSLGAVADAISQLKALGQLIFAVNTALAKDHCMSSDASDLSSLTTPVPQSVVISAIAAAALSLSKDCIAAAQASLLSCTDPATVRAAAETYLDASELRVSLFSPPSQTQDASPGGPGSLSLPSRPRSLLSPAIFLATSLGRHIAAVAATHSSAFVEDETKRAFALIDAIVPPECRFDSITARQALHAAIGPSPN
jgi:hypothetical protein